MGQIEFADIFLIDLYCLLIFDFHCVGTLFISYHLGTVLKFNFQTAPCVSLTLGGSVVGKEEEEKINQID